MLTQVYALSSGKNEVYPNIVPDTKRTISRMTNLDPAKRANMDEILEDPWWNNSDTLPTSK